MASLTGSSVPLPPPAPSSEMRDTAIKSDIKVRSQEERIRALFGVAAIIIILGVLAALFFTVRAADDAQRAADAAVEQSQANEEILKTLAAAGVTRQTLLEQSREADIAAAKRSQLILDVLCSHVIPEVDCGEVFIVDGKPVLADDLPPTTADLVRTPDAAERAVEQERQGAVTPTPAPNRRGTPGPRPAPSEGTSGPRPTPAPAPAPTREPVVSVPLPRSPLLPSIVPTPVCVSVICVGG